MAKAAAQSSLQTVKDPPAPRMMTVCLKAPFWSASAMAEPGLRIFLSTASFSVTQSKKGCGSKNPVLSAASRHTVPWVPLSIFVWATRYRSRVEIPLGCGDPASADSILEKIVDS